jgi:hypothetical protein
MARYKYAHFLGALASDAFDQLHTPGSDTPFSGIYRCDGCGREVVAEFKKPLPPQNHHQHLPVQGLIRWRLIVFADHQPK